MSRIKFILFWLGAFCMTNLSFGQQATMPTKCTNPGGGISVGGAFSLNIEFGCLDFANNASIVRIQNPLAPNGATLVGGNYIFNLRDGVDITRPGAFSAQLDTTVTTPGIYWVMQGGNVGGQVYVTCKAFEIIKTEKPDIKVSSCGTNSITVTFLNTPKNKAHGKYRILWGDGDEANIDNLSAISFPFDKSHTYLTPLPPNIKPQIVGIYTRGAGGTIEACPGQPYSFEFETNNKPKISELEGLTGGTSNKITMVEGTDGKEYTLEQKPKSGTWTDTGRKITRNTGETFKTETVTGLNATNEYCFRLKTIDGCSNPITSNEVCTIIPKATLISPTDVKIDWNNPLPTITRNIISYSENPTGANANSGSPVTPTGTTYNFNQLVCNKKYNFQITSEIGTGADLVKIKSPTIIVDPLNAPKLTPSTIGLVSVVNSDMISFNVFEITGLTSDKYVFYRSEGGTSNFTNVHESTQNRFDDRSVEPTKQQYCYKVAYKDGCGRESDLSPAYCSILLTSSKANTLNWTPAAEITPAIKSISYIIETIDENDNITDADLSTNLQENVGGLIENLLNLNTNGEAKFRVKALVTLNILIGGSIVAFPVQVYSNTYTFITPAQLYIPTAFSPNEDGVNDKFEAKGRYIVQFNLEVYDRWGNVIFESSDLGTGWNGTASDGITPAPPGNYGFKVYGLDPAGQKFEKVGSVTLIR